MATFYQGPQLAGRLKAVQDAQRRISEKMNAIQAQLKKLQNVPGTQPWVSFGRIHKIKDLKSSFPDLRTALKHDLLILKNTLRALKVSEKNISTAIVRKTALQNSRDFKKRLEKALKEAEKSGQLDENELRNLLNESEHILEGFVNLLEANPSEENIGQVFSEMEVPLLLGSDSDSGRCGRALRAAGKAAKILYDRDEKRFRKKPDVNNFTKMLGSKASGYLVGNEFDEKPKNWKGAPPGTVHPVAPGDSLSAISQKYYGNPGFWDIIYFENLGIIGDNPDVLKVGLHLIIP
jgi:hypothetical protein